MKGKYFELNIKGFYLQSSVKHIKLDLNKKSFSEEKKWLDKAEKKSEMISNIGIIDDNIYD